MASLKKIFFPVWPVEIAILFAIMAFSELFSILKYDHSVSIAAISTLFLIASYYLKIIKKTDFIREKNDFKAVCLWFFPCVFSFLFPWSCLPSHNSMNSPHIIRLAINSIFFPIGLGFLWGTILFKNEDEALQGKTKISNKKLILSLIISSLLYVILFVTSLYLESKSMKHFLYFAESERTAWKIFSGKAPMIGHMGTDQQFHHWALNFKPAYYINALFYYLIDSPIATYFFLSLMAPLSLLFLYPACKKAGASPLISTALCIAYLFSWLNFDFQIFTGANYAILANPALAGALWAFLGGKKKLFIVFILLLAILHQSFLPLIPGFSLYILAIDRKKLFKSFLLGALSIFLYWIHSKIRANFLVNGELSWHWGHLIEYSYSQFGSNKKEIFLTYLIKPWRVIFFIFSSLRGWMMALWTVLFLSPISLISPVVLLISIFQFLYISSMNGGFFDANWYNLIPIAPIVAIAAAMTAKKLEKDKIHLYKNFFGKDLFPFRGKALAVFILISGLFTSRLAWRMIGFPFRWPDKRYDTVRKLTDSLDKSLKVTAQSSLALSVDRYQAIGYDYFNSTSDLILFDIWGTRDNAWNNEQFCELLGHYFESNQHFPRYYENGIMLFSRSAQNLAPFNHPLFSEEIQPYELLKPQPLADKWLKKKKEKLDFGLDIESFGIRGDNLYRSSDNCVFINLKTDKSLPSNLKIKIQVMAKYAKNPLILADFSVFLGKGIYPTENWRSHEIYQECFIIWLPPWALPGPAKLYISVLETENNKGKKTWNTYSEENQQFSSKDIYLDENKRVSAWDDNSGKSEPLKACFDVIIR